MAAQAIGAVAATTSGGGIGTLTRRPRARRPNETTLLHGCPHRGREFWERRRTRDSGLAEADRFRRRPSSPPFRLLRPGRAPSADGAGARRSRPGGLPPRPPGPPSVGADGAEFSLSTVIAPGARSRTRCDVGRPWRTRSGHHELSTLLCERSASRLARGRPAALPPTET